MFVYICIFVIVCILSALNKFVFKKQGNEGGGLFCEHQLAGILSFGVGCGQANNPAVFTQIRFYSEWIDEQVSTAVNATESVWSFESSKNY